MKRPEIPPLFSTDEIADRVAAMAQEVAKKMPSNLMVVGLLKGSFVFAADLLRELHLAGLQPQVDFLTLSSYGSARQSGGRIEVISDLAESVAGKDVLIVDDILESGRTLHHARELMQKRGATSVRIAVLLEKPGKRDMAITADFVGFSIPDRFVVGYGLDYAGHYRELPYIGVIDIH